MPFKRRFNGRTVLKYGAPRIVFGTFRRYGNAVELPCYGSKTGTLFCPLLYINPAKLNNVELSSTKGTKQAEGVIDLTRATTKSDNEEGRRRSAA